MRRIALLVTMTLAVLAVPALALDPGETVLVYAVDRAGRTRRAATTSSTSPPTARCAVFGVERPRPSPQANGSTQIYLRDTEAKYHDAGQRRQRRRRGRRRLVRQPGRHARLPLRGVGLGSDEPRRARADAAPRLPPRSEDRHERARSSRADGPGGADPTPAAFKPTIVRRRQTHRLRDRAKNLVAAGQRRQPQHRRLRPRRRARTPRELVSARSPDAGITGFAGRRLLHRRSRPTGAYVAFDTEAENLTAEDADSVSDVSCATASPARRRSSAGRRAPPAPRAHTSSGLAAALGRRHSRVAFASVRRPTSAGTRPSPARRLRPRPGRGHDRSLVSPANGAAGAPGNADFGRLSAALRSRRRHQGRLPLAGHEPRPGHARLVRDPVVPARTLATNTDPRRWRDGAAQLTVAGDQRRREHVAFLTATGSCLGDTDGQLDVYRTGTCPGPAAAVPPRRPTPTPTATPADPGPAAPAPPPRPGHAARRGRLRSAAPPTTSTSPARRSTST